MIGFRGSRAALRRSPGGRLGLLVVLAGAVALGMATPTVAAVAAAAVKPPAPSPGPAVKGVVDAKPHFVSQPDQARHGYVAAATMWPAAASAPAGLAAPASGARAGARGAVGQAAGTPVWAQAVAGKSGYAGPRSLTVRMLDHGAAQAAGVTGAVFTVTPAAAAPVTPVVSSAAPLDANAAVTRAVSSGGWAGSGAAGSGTVRVGLDYSSFAQASGGNFGSRLTLVRLPACAVTTPTVPACQVQTPVASANDVNAGTVSGQVALGSTGRAVVLAATTSAGQEGGSGGSYAATSLKPSGSWSGGGSTGAFTYDYPVIVPAAASSLVPDVGLSYDSSSVDGQTASTQAQASWAGDGWSAGESFVEQSFISCADKPEGTASPVASGDECYDGPVLTLSLGGRSTSLVCNAAETSCREAEDTGDVVAHVTGSNNGSGTYNTDYWTITERDGTVYSFGRNQLPGWASGKAVTGSVASMPVYSAHSGDPCYHSTGFADSVCTMAYRWNLDYVKDAHGNAMAYYYKNATNFYGEDNGAHDVSYVRDTYLWHIDYGFTDGNAYGTIPDQVYYNTGDRCVSGTCQPLNSANKANWPDVPFDLICASGVTCTSGQYSPSFFSTVRLTAITAQQWAPASSSYVTVDSYALDTAHFPATGDGTSPTLWLASVTRTGSDTTAGGSSSSITLPPVTFTGIQLQNRVDTVTDGLPPMYRFRIATITTETGSVISPAYSQPNPCTAPVTIPAASNTSSCYPVYWTPQDYTAPLLDWFNSWTVASVTQTDPTGGAPVARTDYQYLGGAAWHYDDNEVVQPKYRTYGQFRGYADVRTLTGDGTNDPQTQTGVTYYRGMSKDNNTTVVNVTDSLGGAHEDVSQLAGQPLEETAYLGASGPADHSTITSYWVSAAAATRTRSGLPDLTANFTAPAETFTRQALTATGSATWRYTETDTSYDAGTGDANFGLPVRVYTHTSPVNSAYDSCATVTYAAANTAANIVGLVAESETDSVACGGFTAGSPASVPAGLNTLTAPASVSRPAQVVSDTRTFYDDTGYSTTFPQPAAPSKGDVTMTRKASGYSGGAFSYQTTARSAYDSYGRVTAAYDGNGNKTTTAYATASGLTTATTVTNPLNQAASATLDPERGLTLTSTDPNGIVTTQQYDALGRVTGVWLYSRAVNLPANSKFSYQVSNSGFTAVTTQKLNDEAGYETATQIYDAMLRIRQTQANTPNGGRLVTDTFYDTRGLTEATFSNWWDSANTPSTALATTINGSTDLAGQAPDEDYYTYDGLGRQVTDNSENGGAVVSTTTTVYNGDRTTVVPPVGAAVKTTLTDPLGRTSALQEYTTRPAVNTPANVNTGTFTISGGSYDTTSYGYDGHGNSATITSGGRTWTSSYNLLGQVTAKADPDVGSSSMLYDGNGNLTQSTDSRGKVISYTYDALDRKTGQYDSASGAQSASNQLAAWVYDNSNAVAGVTDAVGHLTTETAYWGGAAYTTQQKAFNVFGGSLGETVTIPSATEGSVLGKSYTFTHVYTSLTGLLLKDAYPAAGGLPAETALYGYGGLLDMPTTLGGLVGYAEGTDYDAWGRVLHEGIGNSSGLADITNAYNPHDGTLKTLTISRETATPATVDTEAYRYDLAGNTTAHTSTRLGATATSETQCYGYDPLARLTAAWTATDDCATTPAPSAHSMVGDNLSSASAYWTTWGFDAIGNRTSQVDHATASGGTDTTTSYAYNGNGAGQPDTLTGTTATGGSTATTSYGYDPAGNMTSRAAGQGNQSLTWDDAGRLTGITGSSSGPSSFIYDADGNLLLEKDPGATTLYLPGEQITLHTSDQSTTGIRYFDLPGGGTAYRTGVGTAYGYEIDDQQGTNLLTLDYTAQVPTWRQQTPYGAARGAAVAWIDNRAFLDKPADATTGLDIVGARSYDPATGRFISVDPVRAADAPLVLNGYGYTADNPVTGSDPSGAMPCDAEGHCGSVQAIVKIEKAEQAAQENYAESNRICYYCRWAPPSLANSQPAGGGGSGGGGHSSGGTYSSYQCGRFGLSCSNFDPKSAVPKSGGFNPFNWVAHTALPWVGHQFRAHWRGMVQTGVFVGCLLASMGACLAAEGAGILIDYFANGMQYGFGSKQAWQPAVKSVVIDTLAIPFGVAASRVGEEGILLTSGLRSADSEDTVGMTGKLFGSYAPYIPRHANDFVGYNQAVQFFAHPIPVLFQVGGRAAVNSASCNGGHTEDYC
jgi:RHS repeat-associated protein